MADTARSEELLREANQHWANGNELAALESFCRAVLESPQDLASNQRFTLFMLSRLAFAFQAKGDEDGLKRAWEAFLNFEPENAFARKQLGLSHFRLGNATEAALLLGTLIAAGSPVQTRVIDALAETFAAAGNSATLLAQRFFQLELLGRSSTELLAKFQAPARSVLDRSHAICVCGMHRAGTSMVSRLLEHVGVHLGPPGLLFGPQPDNPDGFFENAPMQQLNKDILSELGGAWDCPPVEDAVPNSDPFIHFKGRATLLAAGIAAGAPAGAPWAWKDPRNSLTLPFWLETLSTLKIVVVVRDPGDVAASLVARSRYGSAEFGLSLWHEYYRRILASTAQHDVLVVAYESFFEAPERTIDRLARFAGTTPEQEQLAGALGSIRHALRHNDSSLPWKELPAGRELLPLHAKLNEMADVDQLRATKS